MRGGEKKDEARIEMFYFQELKESLSQALSEEQFRECLKGCKRRMEKCIVGSGGVL